MGSYTFADLRRHVADLGHWNITSETLVDYARVTRACHAGLRRIARLGAFTWLDSDAEIDLVADTYKYPIPPLVNRVDTRTFLLLTDNNTRSSGLHWRHGIHGLNREHGPTWRFDPARRGVPLHVTIVGVEMWVAPVPSEAGKVVFETTVGESEDGHLRLPDFFFDCAVHAALAEGLKGKDDDDQAYYEKLFDAQDKEDLLSNTVYLHVADQMGGSPIAEATRANEGRYLYSVGDGYDFGYTGDGY